MPTQSPDHSSDAEARGVRPPRQARSRQTLERIVRAAEDLIDDRSFEEVSVAEIVDRSGSSTGSFYTRFEDKRALLTFLDDRFAARARQMWESALDPERWQGAPLAAVLRHFVEVMVTVSRQKGGFLRSLFCQARCHRKGSVLRRGAEMSAWVVELLTRLLAGHPEVTHPDPKRALALGLLFVGATVRELVTFENLGLFPLDLEDHEIVEELSRAFASYLTMDTSSAGARELPGPGGRP